MELKEISNDNENTIYVEGHIPLSTFHIAVRCDGYTTKGPVSHAWMVEGPVPEEHGDDFLSWFTFCDADEPGAFPVTCATV